MATGDTLAVHCFQVELGGIQIESIQEISGLTLEVDTIEVKQVSPTGQTIIRKLPGARQAGEVTITRGMDKSDEFTKWIKDSMEGKIDDARKDISIIMTKADQQSDERRFNLSKGWVTKWEGPELKAGESSHATEKVTITFEEIVAE